MKLTIKALVTLAVSSTFLSVPVFAQVLEEVIVTAQKREQSIQDVGISITALSGDTINALGLDNMMEITQQIPGLQVQSYTPSFTTWNLRGVSQNNFTDNLEAPVAVYIDDIYYASMNAIGLSMFDMERIEVLRGPQGTLFGRNATGGVISYVTNKADDDENNGYASATFADFGTVNFEGAIGGAISDTVRGRVAVRRDSSDGYLEPGIEPFGGTQATAGTLLGNDGTAIRASLQIDASDSVLIDLGATYSTESDVPGTSYTVTFADFDPDTGLGIPLPVSDDPMAGGTSLAGDPHLHASNGGLNGMDPYYDRDALQLRAKVDAQLSNGNTFRSITGYLNNDKYYTEDACGGLCYFPFTTDSDFTSFSQEFQLSGEGESSRWQVGAYYLNAEWDNYSAVGGATITGSEDGSIETNILIDSTNWSVYGQGEWDLSDKLTLIGGLRWSQDNKDLALNQIMYRMEDQGIPDGTMTFNLADEAVGEYAHVPNIDYGDWAGRLQLNMYPSDDTLVFLSWNRGIKGGNWTAAAGVLIEDIQHTEEVLNAFELGIKTTFADGAARLNATVFSYDYDDYQAFALPNLAPEVSNSDATASGGELELLWSPGDGWDVVLGAAFVSSTVDFVKAVFPGSGVTNAEFPQAPRSSFNALVRKAWDMGNGGELAMQLDGNWNDDNFVEGTNALVSLQKAYSVANVSATYSTDRYSASVWVKNLGDEDYLLYNLDLGLAGFIEQIYAPPRQVGVTLRMNW